MAFILRIMQKLGFFAPKEDTQEVFGNRLTRISTREQRREVSAQVFVKSAL